MANRRRTDRGMPTWDLPVRVFHWALMSLVISQLVTASLGGNAMQFHAFGGYAIMALVWFRILWGFLGGTRARFSDFVRGPATVIRYANSILSGPHPPHRGHNPLGGWSMLAMLVSLLVKKENLIVPMITGRKPSTTADESARYGSLWLAVLLLGCSAAAVYFVVRI